MHGHFVELARRNDADDPIGVGSALIALIPGYGLQRVLLGRPDLETYLARVRRLLG